MKIGSRPIGKAQPCFIIGEVGLAHEGSLGMAMAYVDAIAASGADCGKFQMHIAEFESTSKESFRVPGIFPQDATRYDYWERTAFTFSEWRRLKQYTESKGLIFLCSPFSVEAVSWLEELGVLAYKVPSGMVMNLPLIRRIGETKKPVILSSGMATTEELIQIHALLNVSGCDTYVVQCTSEYPCPPEHWGLNYIMPDCGFSDNSGTIAAGLAAVTLGASILEVHVCFSKEEWGPDIAASLTMEQLRELVKGVHQIGLALRSPVDKNEMAKRLNPMRRMFMPSKQADGSWKKSGDGATI